MKKERQYDLQECLVDYAVRIIKLSGGQTGENAGEFFGFNLAPVGKLLIALSSKAGTHSTTTYLVRVR